MNSFSTDFEHLVITRFCIRDYNKYVEETGIKTGRSDADVLDPKNLQLRITLLENITYPSIINQSNQHFKWIILIDKELPSNFKRSLALLTVDNQIFIEEVNHEQRIGYNHWISKYLDDHIKYLITSHLDDDDALHVDFIEKIQKLYFRDFVGDSAIIRLYGSSKAIQWNLVFSRGFSFGRKSDWHRIHLPAVSCGFTCIARYPEIPLYIMSFMHSKADLYFDSDYVADTNGDHDFNVFWVRYQLSQLLDSNPDSGPIEFNDFVDTLAEIEQPLMTNHFLNLQPRLVEKQNRSEVVMPKQDFEGYHVNWDGIQQNRSLFRISSWEYNSRLFAFRFGKLKNQIKKSLKIKYFHLESVIKGVLPSNPCNKYELINWFAREYGYNSYLEISCMTTGNKFDKVDPLSFKTKDCINYHVQELEQIYQNQGNTILGDHEVSILPFDSHLNRLLNQDKKYDVVFVDAFHTVEHTMRDLEVALTLLSEKGIIIVHDCLPSSESMIGPLKPGAWCGQTFEGYIRFILKYDSFENYVFNIDFGCGVIRPFFRNLEKNSFEVDLDKVGNWDYFWMNHRALLNLQPIYRLYEIYGTRGVSERVRKNRLSLLQN